MLCQLKVLSRSTSYKCCVIIFSKIHCMHAEDNDSLLTLQVGLPAKSGVAGGILLVVPNVMGLMCWSPPLDKMGNSVKGIHFCHVSSVAIFSSAAGAY